MEVTIIIAWEPISAARLNRILVEAAEQHSGKLTGVSFPVPMLITNSHDCSSVLQKLEVEPNLKTPNAIIIACDEIASWVAFADKHRTGVRLLYVRPGLLSFQDSLFNIPSRPDAEHDFSTRLLIVLDQILVPNTLVTVEALFFEPRQLAESIASVFHPFEFSEPQILAEREREYAQTVAITLRRVADGEVNLIAGMRHVETGRTYPTSKGKLGLGLLGPGWSGPEEDHIWTDGPHALIRLPIEPKQYDFANESVWLLIRGQFARQHLPMKVISCGQTLPTVWRSENDNVGAIAQILLPQAILSRNSRVVDLALLFDETFGPAKGGINSDTRQLGLALQSLQIITTKRPIWAAELSDLLLGCRARTVASLGLHSSELIDQLIGIGVTTVLYCTADFAEVQTKQQSLPDLSNGILQSLLCENPLESAKRDAVALDLILVWDDARFGPTLEQLSQMVRVGRYPEIIVRTSNPNLFNATWWSHRSAFEMAISDADVVVKPNWIHVRPARYH